MTESDRKFMLKIGERLGVLEREIAQMRGKGTNIPQKAPSESIAAKKFFGEAVSKEPECDVHVKFKTDSVDRSIIPQVENGQKLLLKAVMEFCAEFDMREFTISYTDPTDPKK